MIVVVLVFVLLLAYGVVRSRYFPTDRMLIQREAYRAELECDRLLAQAMSDMEAATQPAVWELWSFD